MAARKQGKHYMEWGRRLKGSRKAGRSGSSGAKRRRKTWGQAPGAVQEAKPAQRRFKLVRGRVYGPFGGERVSS